jgi:hypothetical protein
MEIVREETDDVQVPTNIISSAPPLFNEYMILQRHNFPTDPYDDLISEPNHHHHHHHHHQQQQQIVSSAQSSYSEEYHNTNHLRHHRTQGRNLFLFGTATGSICSLSSDIFYFNQDPMTQLYYWNGDKNDLLYSEVDSMWNSTVLDRWKVADQIQARYNLTVNTTDDGNTYNNSVAVRACLCTQYLNRPIEFCSAEYLSCSVQTTPVKCFTLSSTYTFIESFWPVTIFWMLVVLYVWSCSDPGRIARQYYQRKLRCCRSRAHQPLMPTNIDTNTSEPPPIEGQEQEQSLPPTATNLILTDDQMVQQQLDAIIENYPSRANYMYREAINRQNRQERYERQRQNSLWYRTYQQLKQKINFICSYRVNRTNNNDIENINEIADVTTTGEGNQMVVPPSVVTEPSGPRLLLKTKVYYYDDFASPSTSDPSHNMGHMYSEQPLEELPATTSSIVPSKVIAASETNMIDDDNNSNSHSNYNNNTDGDEIRCAICLLPLQDGVDIIGDLPCRHCMHKHCLKEWLQRKNRCPLCQLSDVAKFQNDTPPTTTTHTIGR